MYVRRFSADSKTKIPGGHPGLYGAFIFANRASVPTDPAAVASYTERMHGMPLAFDVPVQVEAMYFEPHARLDEHSAPIPILFMVTSGRGMLRTGGPLGETREIRSGDAVLWPEALDQRRRTHKNFRAHQHDWVKGSSYQIIAREPAVNV